jgi:hypothetical protein
MPRRKRPLVALAVALSLTAGCVSVPETTQRVRVGPARFLEDYGGQPTPYRVTSSATAQTVTIQLAPGQCRSLSETPTAVDTITYDKPRIDNLILLSVAGAAAAGLGGYALATAKNHPAQCPPDDDSCSTKDQIRDAGIIFTVGGGTAFLYGAGRAILPPTETVIEGPVRPVTKVVTEYPCRQSVQGVPVVLAFANGAALRTATNESGAAVFDVSDTAGLRSAYVENANVLVGERPVGAVELADLTPASPPPPPPPPPRPDTDNRASGLSPAEALVVILGVATVACLIKKAGMDECGKQLTPSICRGLAPLAAGALERGYVNEDDAAKAVVGVGLGLLKDSFAPQGSRARTAIDMLEVGSCVTKLLSR